MKARPLLALIVASCLTQMAFGQDLVQKGKLKAQDSTTVHVALRVAGSLYVLDKSNSISRDELLQTDGLAVTIGHPRHGLSYEVVGFVITTVWGDSVLQAVSTAADLTSEQKAVIAKAPIGSELYLENVRARVEDGPVRNLASSEILIK